MRNIDLIVWHCSASDRPDQCSFEAIQELHMAPESREFQWGKYKTTGKNFDYVGYHSLISKEASILRGRDERIAGAHCFGFNAHSLGLCLMGDELFTDWQIESALLTTHGWMRKYGIPQERVLGHYELAKYKSCPNIDMEMIRKNL